jgi:hypothetical protein
VEGSVTITDWRVLAVLLGFVLALVLVATGKVDALIALLQALLGRNDRRAP